MRRAYLLILSFICTTAFATEKPNILIILADDLGYADVGYHGSKEAITPNIDALANSGIFFTAGYSAAPVCGPSRAGLLTGRYQNRFGYQDNIGPYGREAQQEQGTPLSIKMMGNYFQDLDYHTGMIGKWHDGDEQKFWPNNRGFDYFYGFNNGAANYFIGNKNLQQDKWGAIHRNNKKLLQVGDYLTDEFGNEAMQYIERQQASPFLLYLSFNAVHGPLQAPKHYLDKFKHISSTKRKTLLAMNYAMDLNIGKVLNKLKELKLLEKTLIFFSSDNGGKPKGNFSYNHPLRGTKGETFEGGIRVPFCLSWKGKIPAGQKSDQIVHSIDLLPTILHAANTKQKTSLFDGQNLLPYLLKQTTQLPERHLYCRLNTNWSVRNSNWKLMSMNGKEYLFNIKKDLSEKENLIQSFPEIAKSLNKQMLQWDQKNEAPRWGWNKNTCPNFIGYRNFKTEEDLLKANQKKKK